MKDDKFLQYLKKHYPHLYKFQMKISEIVEDTGFGDVSASCVIRYKKVASWDVGGWSKTIAHLNEKLRGEKDV